MTAKTPRRPVRLSWPARGAEAWSPSRPTATPIARWRGEASDGLNAQLWASDAETTLDHLLQTGLEGGVDLIHLDPPFGSEANYDRRLTVAHADGPLSFQLRAYGDRDGDDLAGYLDILEPVLRRAHRLLRPSGCLYLHLDPRRGPYARVLLDEIFGGGSFVNQVVWAYGLGGSSRRRFGRKHDVIYLFAKDPKQMYFDPPKEEATSSMLAGQPKLATDIWETTDDDAAAPLLRAWPDPLVRRTMSNRDPERTGYPTQKPLSLCERMISASCPPGGLVVDPMAGSGTAIVAAARLGRRVIGGDMGGPALDVCRARLLPLVTELELSTLNGHITPSPWVGAEPLSAAADTWSLRPCEPPAATAARLKIAQQPPQWDMRALWSGWGFRAPSGEIIQWHEAGPARTRPPCPESLPQSDAARRGEWFAVDVTGTFWTATPPK